MSLQRWCAVSAAIVLSLVMILQLLLAAGLPLGQAAWQGRYRVLPPSLRWASLATVGVLGLALWVVLARAGLVAPGARPLAIRAATWLFAGFWALNTLGNAVSQSATERYLMTPATLFLLVTFVIVALLGTG